MRPAVHTPRLTAGIDVASGDGPDAIRRADEGKAKSECDAEDADLVAGDHGSSATKKHQDEGANQFRKIFLHIPSCSCSSPRDEAGAMHFPPVGRKSREAKAAESGRRSGTIPLLAWICARSLAERAVSSQGKEVEFRGDLHGASRKSMVAPNHAKQRMRLMLLQAPRRRHRRRCGNSTMLS